MHFKETVKAISKNKWVRIVFMLTLFLCYCILMTIFVGSACPFELITGLPCPACGMTRANLLALQFKFSEAFAMHPLFFVSYIAAAALVVFTLKPKLALSKPITIAALTLSAAFIAVYIYRIIVFFPHTEPMAYNFKSLFGLIRIHFGF